MFFSDMPNFFFTIASTIQEPLNKDGWVPTNTGNAIGQFFFVIIAFVIVIILAYYSTRWIASAKMSRKGGNLNLIESMSMGQQGSLQIVKVGSRYLLIGVTKDNISLVSEINEGDIDKEIRPQILNTSFEKYFNGIFNKKDSADKQNGAGRNGRL